MKLIRRLLAGVLALVIAISVGSAVAQEAAEWSPANRVTGYAVDSLAPYLVADQNRTVHAFNSQLTQDVVAVVYRQWTAENGWTEPVDILLPVAGGQSKVLGAALDPAGTIHLIYYSSSERGSSIYYSQAPAAAAGKAASWTAPKLIGPGAGPVSQGAMAMGADGRIFVVYSGRRAGLGVYGVSSPDGGKSWSKPETVFLTYSEGRWASSLRMLLDSRGTAHSVWSAINDDSRGQAVYYSRRDLDQDEWSEPAVVAVPSSYEVDSPAIAEHGGQLLLVYHEGMPTTHWMLRSPDWGGTWTGPKQMLPQLQGEYGPPVFLRDSANTLRAILGGHRGNPTIHGIWQSRWDGEAWTAPEPVVSGPLVRVSAGEAFNPTFPSAVVSQGNVLLVTWITDGNAGQNGVWFSRVKLDTPELPVVPLPAAPPAPAPAVPSAASPAAVPAAQPLPAPQRLSPEQLAPQPGRLPGQGLIEDRGVLITVLSLLPAALVLFFIVGAAIARRTSRIG